jgi:SAM-dependent methyltransferase
VPSHAAKPESRAPHLSFRPRELRRRFYSPAFLGMFDRFQEAVNGAVPAGSVVLDAGCGRGRTFLYRRRLPSVRVVGLDLSPHARDNPNVDSQVRGTVETLPFPDASFDAVLCTHVAEHLPHPEAAFGEMARVLRPGGRLLLLTPNRRHYVPLVARVLPLRLHVAVSRRRGLNQHDVFPTLYRANTPADLRRLVRGAGLCLERLQAFETEPEYLAFHPLAYAAGVAYERVVNRFRALAPLRVNLLLVARKV